MNIIPIRIEGNNILFMKDYVMIIEGFFLKVIPKSDPITIEKISNK